MAARVASGPGFWTEWLAELDRQGLLEDLLADGVIARALREAPSGHKYDRVLTAKMTVICVLVACLFPGAGYDSGAGDGVRAARPAAAAGRGGPVRQRVLPGQEAARRAGHEEDLRAGRRRRGRGPGDRPAVEGPGGHRDRRHHDGAGQERRAGRRVRHPRGRRPAAAAGHRARPHRDLPLDRRRDRRLPRRRERPGRPAGRQLPARHAQPRRPRLLLHAPLDPVLRHRRGPGLADQERREIRPAQDPQDPARRL